MKNLEAELRRVMREHASTLTSAPPPPNALTETHGTRSRRRAVVVVAAAAVLALAAGIALPQVLGPPTITPAGDRLVVAAGETEEGPWRLSAYRAQVTGSKAPGGDAATWRCLDLDAPALEEANAPEAQQNSSCTMGVGGLEPIGSHTRVPDFRGSEALVYGEVSGEVARLEMVLEDGQIREVTIVPAPEEWNVPAGYFASFVSGSGKVEFVARARSGEVLERERI